MTGKTRKMMLLVWCLFAPVAAGNDNKGDVVLYDFEGKQALSSIETDYAAAGIVSTDRGRALGIELLSSHERPTVTFTLPEEYRDLSAPAM